MTTKGYKHTLEAREKIAAANRRRVQSPETRAKVSAASKGRTLSPESRAKMSAARTGRPLSPEHRAKISEGRKKYLASLTGEELQQRAAVNYFVGTTALRDVLRERDGGLCQLCLDPIDFSLTRKTSPEGWSASVDHVIPTGWSGSNDLENLWLAHYGCNRDKNMYFIGRKDGTTDVRSAA